MVGSLSRKWPIPSLPIRWTDSTKADNGAGTKKGPGITPDPFSLIEDGPCRVRHPAVSGITLGGVRTIGGQFGLTDEILIDPAFE
jgi:hypothetical protein